jgi:hypothetical protein
MAVFFRLAEIKGLEELQMSDLPVDDEDFDDEDWLTMCEAPQTHPTLTKLDFGYIITSAALSAEQRTARTRAIADMLQTSTAIRTIDIGDDDADQWDTELDYDLIHPRLATNIFRNRLVTVEETTTDPFGKRLLGRALQNKSVQSNSNHVWMVL